jgi:hypothetical protein
LPTRRGDDDVSPETVEAALGASGGASLPADSAAAKKAPQLEQLRAQQQALQAKQQLRDGHVKEPAEEWRAEQLRARQDSRQQCVEWAEREEREQTSQQAAARAEREAKAAAVRAAFSSPTSPVPAAQARRERRQHEAAAHAQNGKVVRALFASPSPPPIDREAIRANAATRELERQHLAEVHLPPNFMEQLAEQGQAKAFEIAAEERRSTELRQRVERVAIEHARAEKQQANAELRQLRSELVEQHKNAPPPPFGPAEDLIGDVAAGPVLPFFEDIAANPFVAEVLAQAALQAARASGELELARRKAEQKQKQGKAALRALKREQKRRAIEEKYGPIDPERMGYPGKDFSLSEDSRITREDLRRITRGTGRRFAPELRLKAKALGLSFPAAVAFLELLYLFPRTFNCPTGAHLQAPLAFFISRWGWCERTLQYAIAELLEFGFIERVVEIVPVTPWLDRHGNAHEWATQASRMALTAAGLDRLEQLELECERSNEETFVGFLWIRLRVALRRAGHRIAALERDCTPTPLRENRSNTYRRGISNTVDNAAALDWLFPSRTLPIDEEAYADKPSSHSTAAAEFNALIRDLVKRRAFTYASAFPEVWAKASPAYQRQLEAEFQPFAQAARRQLAELVINKRLDALDASGVSLSSLPDQSFLRQLSSSVIRPPTSIVDVATVVEGVQAEIRTRTQKATSQQRASRRAEQEMRPQ